MTESPNAPLSFRWYDALFNTARFKRYIANVADMEAHIHQLRAQAVKDNRELDRRAEQLDECRNRIAIMTGAATEQNTPYTVRGNHKQDRPMDRPIDAVRPGDLASDSNRRQRVYEPGSNYADSPTVTHSQDNSAMLAVAAVMLMSDDAQAAPEPEMPAQAVPCAPAYSPPSRNDSYEPSSSSSDNSSPSSD